MLQVQVTFLLCTRLLTEHMQSLRLLQGQLLSMSLWLATFRVRIIASSLLPPPSQGFYFSGDGCRRDADGYYWITGRVDDVINVSGHRIGTAEVESALVSHKACAEAAVVG
jgi:acyl-coenzyme A synthetase/AMP-(fatty) acid ligase